MFLACVHNLGVVPAEWRLYFVGLLVVVAGASRCVSLAILSSLIFLLQMNNSAGMPMSFVLVFSLGALAICTWRSYRLWPGSRAWQGLAGSTLVLGLFSAFLCSSVSPLGFQESCTGCNSNLKNLGAALDAYRDANGSYPDSLKQLVPDYLTQEITCLPYQPTKVAERLYALQDIHFVPYHYEKDQDDHYLLSCRSGGHQWSNTPIGYPKYDSEQGLQSF